MAQILSGDPRYQGPLAGQGYGGPLAPGGWLPDFSEADPSATPYWTPTPTASDTAMDRLRLALPEAAARYRADQYRWGTGVVPVEDFAYGYGGVAGRLLAGLLPPDVSSQNPNSAMDAASMVGLPAVGMVRTVGEVGGAGRLLLSDRAQLGQVYDTMAQQMALDPKKRFQPDPTHQTIDTRYQQPPEGMGELPDLSQRYPRNPDPAAPLPGKDRARPFVEKKEEIAQALAQRIRESGQMEMPTRYFYHSAGPIYRAAMKAGLTAKEAVKWVRDFGEYMGATSPRTEVVPNVRNTTSVMAKEAAGIPHREIVGPGTGGISEKGYPMMTGAGGEGRPAGIHGMHIDAIQSGAGMDPLMNPKPSTFGPNMTGNLSGVTVDTHAIRGAVQTYNRLYPGQVPENFIIKQHRAAYAKDPSKLTPDMIDDSLASQMITKDGKRVEAQTEYPVFADIYHRTAEILGVTPAEAQSMGWFGLGGETNLGSAQETVAKVLNDRISVTAQALKKTPEEVARLLFRRKIPLMSVMGAGAGVAATGILSGAPPEQRPGT